MHKVNWEAMAIQSMHAQRMAVDMFYTCIYCGNKDKTRRTGPNDTNMIHNMRCDACNRTWTQET